MLDEDDFRSNARRFSDAFEEAFGAGKVSVYYAGKAFLSASVIKWLETFGLDAVRLMVVQYSRSLVGFRQLVATDPRFASTSSNAPVTVRTVDEDAQAAKRAIRKERKERERAAKKKQSGR